MRYVLPTQSGHSRCARFGLPQPEHLFILLTSFKALPAYCLWRFFICDVFFFGTARSMEPQISDRKEGTLREIVAVPNIEGGMEVYSWESGDVGPAVEDSVFEAVRRLGKIRGAKGGGTDSARNAMMVIAMCSQVETEYYQVSVATK